MAEVRRDDNYPRWSHTNPDYVDPTIGMGSTSWVGKTAVALSAIVVLVGALLITQDVRN